MDFIRNYFQGTQYVVGVYVYFKMTEMIRSIFLIHNHGGERVGLEYGLYDVGPVLAGRFVHFTPVFHHAVPENG